MIDGPCTTPPFIIDFTQHYASLKTFVLWIEEISKSKGKCHSLEPGRLGERQLRFTIDGKTEKLELLAAEQTTLNAALLVAVQRNLGC